MPHTLVKHIGVFIAQHAFKKTHNVVMQMSIRWMVLQNGQYYVSSIGLCKQCTHLFVVGVDIQTPQQPATGGK
jgi:hypothetical protein